MRHASAPQFLWPQSVRYAAHQPNLWPSDTRPQFFASKDVTFDESVSYYRSHPHRATEVFSPPLFLILEPPPVALVAPPPPSRPAPSGAVAEGEGTGAAGAGGVSSGGAGGVGVEVTPVENTAVLTRQPRPASPPGFPSVPQFPPRSSLQPVAAEPGGVLAGGTGGPGGVGAGGAGSGGAGAGGTGTVAPTPRTVRFRTLAAGAVAAASGESRGGVTSAAAGAVTIAAGESRGGVMAAPREGRAGFLLVAEGAVTDTARESRGVMATAREGSAGVPVAAAGAAAAAAGEGRGGATGAAAGAGTVAADARGGGAAAIAPARLARPSTCTLGLWSPTVPSCSPRPVSFLILVDSLFSPRSCCVSRAPLVPLPCRRSVSPCSPLTCSTCSCPLIASRFVPQCVSRPVVQLPPCLSSYVSRVLSALVTHQTAPLSSVSALVTTVAGFASSHRLDYAAHLVSGPGRSPFSGGAPDFPLEVLEDRQFELGFLVADVPHLCAMLLALEGDPDAVDTPIPRTHAEAVSGP
ncbi:unnamed protein product [Closterium sp. NIES-53]